MADVFDYLAWRGDLPIERDDLNEVDGMILARAAYIPFEHFSQPLPEGFVSFRDIAGQALADGALRREGRWKLQDDRLLEAMGESQRFGALEAGYGEHHLDEVLQVQFSALTVRLGPERYAVVFRGTDNTVIGWKEDMNMSYLCPVPGQRMAADYVRRTAARVPGRLILCGHSKGGNLAAYGAAFCGPEAQARIDRVYNYDGPGFFDRVLDQEGYRAVCGRIHTYVPQFSVVGMLLGRRSERTVVHSTESGLMQHDVYSWELHGPHFQCLETVTEGSRFVDNTIKDWTADMTPEQFQRFVDTVYDLLTDTNMQTMHEMKENWFDTARSFLRTVTDMDEQTRAAALAALKLLAKSAEREAKEVLAGA